MTGNQEPKSVDITQAAIDAGPEVRHAQTRMLCAAVWAHDATSRAVRNRVYRVQGAGVVSENGKRWAGSLMLRIPRRGKQY